MKVLAKVVAMSSTPMGTVIMTLETYKPPTEQINPVAERVTRALEKLHDMPEELKQFIMATIPISAPPTHHTYFSHQQIEVNDAKDFKLGDMLEINITKSGQEGEFA